MKTKSSRFDRLIARYYPTVYSCFGNRDCLFAIGAANWANGHAPCSLGTLWRNWRQYSAAALSYPLAD